MQQRRGVNELDNGGGTDMLSALVAERAGRQQDDHRPQAFAARHHDVLRHLRHQLDVALQALANQRVDGPHIVTGECHDVVEAQRMDGLVNRVHKRAIMPESADIGDF